MMLAPEARYLAPGDAVLRVDDLHKSYGDIEVVRGLSFEIRRGECFALLGPNGAGNAKHSPRRISKESPRTTSISP